MNSLFFANNYSNIRQPGPPLSHAHCCFYTIVLHRFASSNVLLNGTRSSFVINTSLHYRSRCGVSIAPPITDGLCSLHYCCVYSNEEAEETSLRLEAVSQLEEQCSFIIISSICNFLKGIEHKLMLQFVILYLHGLLSEYFTLVKLITCSLMCMHGDYRDGNIEWKSNESYGVSSNPAAMKDSDSIYEDIVTKPR